VKIGPGGMGKPGFPIPPPGGRVWAGAALPGRTFFHPVGVWRSRMGTAGWSPHIAGYGVPMRPGDIMGTPVVCYKVSWISMEPEVNIGPRRGVRGNPVSSHPRPREGLGGLCPPRRTLLSLCGCGPPARAPGPWPVGGSGRAQPSQEQSYVHPVGVQRSPTDG